VCRFVGVIVQRQTPKARFDANWAIKGVLLGKAAGYVLALAAIVERMQREFSLAADVSGSPEEPGELKSNA
jgi:hypothetical protein